MGSSIAESKLWLQFDDRRSAEGDQCCEIGSQRADEGAVRDGTATNHRFVENLLQLIVLDWTVPDLSTMSRRQNTRKVNIPYRGSAGPLHSLIGSTGIKGEGEWSARKRDGTKHRVWRNFHIGIDEQTREIRVAEFTTSNVGDAPMLPGLLDENPLIR
jgi:hypothetical protein